MSLQWPVPPVPSRFRYDTFFEVRTARIVRKWAETGCKWAQWSAASKADVPLRLSGSAATGCEWAQWSAASTADGENRLVLCYGSVQGRISRRTEGEKQESGPEALRCMMAHARRTAVSAAVTGQHARHVRGLGELVTGAMSGWEGATEVYDGGQQVAGVSAGGHRSAY
jgi:hypothetical protein